MSEETNMQGYSGVPGETTSPGQSFRSLESEIQEDYRNVWHMEEDKAKPRESDVAGAANGAEGGAGGVTTTEEVAINEAPETAESSAAHEHVQTSAPTINLPETTTAPIIALPMVSTPMQGDGSSNTAATAALQAFAASIPIPVPTLPEGIAIGTPLKAPSFDSAEMGKEEEEDDEEGEAARANKKRTYSELSDEATSPSKRRVIVTPADGTRCTCKRSQCLKSYCTCFAAGLFCENCGCKGCLNLPQFAEQVDEARKKTLSRNPHAFRPKVEGERHAKGCKCSKTNCLKKYCECYQSGVFCTELCKCTGCKNRSK